MNDKSDAQLLRDYAGHGSESAFREIVRRHTDFVYSAALRQLESADLAADITQKVFVDLARKAKSVSDRLAREASLAGWLHRATRFAALNHLRDNRRRVANERQAMTQLLTDAESSADWEQIRPVLDEALDGLGDEDREALLLRYFKNEDFHAVGLALGVSDDAAQKRVCRAVNRLRDFFSKQNVTVGAGGLAVLISANAVQSAPIGLAAAISAAAVLAGTTVATSTAVATTKVIAMSTLQKLVIGTAFAAAIGAGIFEAHHAAQLREQNRAFQQQQASLADQNQQVRRDLNAATNQLAALLAENEQLRSNKDETELLKLRGEVETLRQRLNSDRATRLNPESGSTGSSDSTNVISSEDQFILKRTHAVDTTGALLQAMKDYAAGNNGQYPESLDQLIASGHFAASNFSGNLGPNDFEIPPPGTTNFQGEKILLQLRVPIRRPGEQSTMVSGAIDDNGIIHTEIFSISE